MRGFINFVVSVGLVIGIWVLASPAPETFFRATARAQSNISMANQYTETSHVQMPFPSADVVYEEMYNYFFSDLHFDRQVLTFPECQFLIGEYPLEPNIHYSEAVATANAFLFGEYEFDSLSMTPIEWYAKVLDYFCYWDAQTFTKKYSDYNAEVVQVAIPYWANKGTEASNDTNKDIYDNAPYLYEERETLMILPTHEIGATE